MNPLVIGLGLLALSYGKTGAKLLELKYFPKRLKNEKGKFTMIIDVLNPGKKDLNVKTFFGMITANGKEVASLEKGNMTLIKASGRTEFRLPAVPLGFGLGRAIADVVDGKKVEWRILGKINADGHTYAVNEKFDVGS